MIAVKSGHSVKSLPYRYRFSMEAGRPLRSENPVRWLSYRRMFRIPFGSAPKFTVPCRFIEKKLHSRMLVQQTPVAPHVHVVSGTVPTHVTGLFVIPAKASAIATASGNSVGAGVGDTTTAVFGAVENDRTSKAS